MAEYGKEIFSMRITGFLIAVLISCVGVNTSLAQKQFAVVELFTSEGCHSCPPAENVLSGLKADASMNKRNVYCLEYHVDYWNRLGWKDPYSSFQHTMRQKNYISVLNEESIYTPMMVVNGTTSFIGSDSEKARMNVAAALASPQSVQLAGVHVDSVANDTLYVSYLASATDKNYFIRVAIIENGLVSEIRKGENAGRTLTHDGVVRVFFSGDLKSKLGILHVPLKKFKPNENCELVAFIQHKQTMRILAAASAEF
jgi:hypothetical protein